MAKSRDKIPATQAIRELKKHKVKFVPRLYNYEEKGGTKVSARELGVDEYSVIKTLVMEDEKGQPLIILMHGSCEVSQKHLARQLKVKQISPCSAEKADRLTGYQTGGISPFGTKQQLPVYVEESILSLESLCINGGKRGLLVEIDPQVLVKILNPTPVSVAI
ncbi:Cys-tRNA(Pro) deacylase [Malonomonas rubra DSM 5091]|uniref:Cys-tRNA(Pro)/Cys-tRNA(Cys) deacylase n=1 Tax=Malonomonas rubra DSM 5091 TaxID=1122189 RepID=A0A1M6CKB0_MALRU|nr:aminoacyl-tRNA deacylase [Malonomonas rubra]SHI61363.1 Cys-tRNA(Pro) deacylase [Malonomonas rubra DSM 5091]